MNISTFFAQTHYKRVVIQTLKRIAKHSAELAQHVVECGGLSAFLICIEEQDIPLKEAALCGIGCITKQSVELATLAIEHGAITLLVMCLQHTELTIKQLAACVLADISVHSSSLAEAICNGGALIHLTRSLDNIDTKLKKNALTGLANIADHNLYLAQLIVEAEAFPKVLIHLEHESDMIKRQAARLVQNIVKHSLNLAQLIINSGGIGALMQLLFGCTESEEDLITPTAYSLGYISGQSPHFALAVIECKGVTALSMALALKNKTDTQLTACVWALGHIGKHTPEHSRALADNNVFTRILELYLKESSSSDLKEKCKCALKMTLQYCLHLPALEPLLYTAPPEIMKYILGQFCKVLPKDPAARRLFITTGSLKKVQEIRTEPGSHLYEYITLINSCFPDDVIRFYTPGFSDSILERIDLYQPTQSTLMENLPTASSSSSCADIFSNNNKTIGDGVNVAK